MPESTSKGLYVVLRASQAVGISKAGTWQPTEAEIGGLEASLPLISYLRAENWSPRYHVSIDHPQNYFRQYVPVLRKGKKLIYINAFCEQTPDWRQRFAVILDGGTCCWQALYDPTAHAFLTLTINGEA